MALKVSFGNVKPLQFLAEDDYVLRVTDWEITETKTGNTEGKNLKVKFQLVDPVQPACDKDGKPTGEDGDFSKLKFSFNTFFFIEDPWSIAPLVCALKNVDDPKDLDEDLDIEDKAEFIGETCAGRLIRSYGTDGKSYLNPTQDGFSPVPF